MTEKMAIESMGPDVEQQKKQASYPKVAKRLAKWLYAIGFSEEHALKVLEAQGYRVPKERYRQWRYDAAPDGQDWEGLRKDMQLVPPAISAVQGIEAQKEAYTQIGHAASRLYQVSISALDSGQLYDAEGALLEKAYTEDGDEVPLTGMRPRNWADVRLGLKDGAATLVQVMDAVSALESEEERDHERRRELAHAIIVTLREAGCPLSDKQMSTLKDVQQEGVSPKLRRELGTVRPEYRWARCAICGKVLVGIDRSRVDGEDIYCEACGSGDADVR